MTKCKGCGITLQEKFKNDLGYTPDINNSLCERCFKIKNYNYKDNQTVLDKESILNRINILNGIKFFLCDLLTINNDILDLYDKIAGKKIFIVTKSDIIPNNYKKENIKNNLAKYLNDNNIYFVSIKNEESLKNIATLITEDALFVGPTSSGKSTLINYLFGTSLTTSSNKNTTQDIIEIKYEDKTIYDFPGFNLENASSILVKKALKPKTLHLKKEYELVIDNNIISFADSCDLVLFFSPEVSIITRKKKHTFKNNIPICKNDILFNKGFIYIKNRNILECDFDANIRPSMVGDYNE